MSARSSPASSTPWPAPQRPAQPEPGLGGAGWPVERLGWDAGAGHGGERRLLRGRDAGVRAPARARVLAHPWGEPGHRAGPGGDRGPAGGGQAAAWTGWAAGVGAALAAAGRGADRRSGRAVPGRPEPHRRPLAVAELGVGGGHRPAVGRLDAVLVVCQLRAGAEQDLWGLLWGHRVVVLAVPERVRGAAGGGAERRAGAADPAGHDRRPAPAAGTPGRLCRRPRGRITERPGMTQRPLPAERRIIPRCSSPTPWMLRPGGAGA